MDDLHPTLSTGFERQLELALFLRATVAKTTGEKIKHTEKLEMCMK